MSRTTGLVAWVVLASPALAVRGGEPQFVRGDVVEILRPGIRDAVRILAHLFDPESRPPLRCLDAADVNDDGKIDLADPVHLLRHIFLGGSPPAYPYPYCGRDETPDDLGCEYHDLCRPTAESAEFYGQELDADAVFFVIERSQFLQGNGELNIAKRELASWVGRAPSKTRFGIVFVDSGVLQFPESDDPATLEDRRSATAALEFTQGVPGGHGACLLEGLSVALLWVARSGVERSWIVYLGAGAPDCPPESDEEYLSQVLRRVVEVNQGRAIVNTIGELVRNDRSDSFLRELAGQNGGWYLRVDR